MACGIKLTYEEVRRYFADHGCELLDKEYKNARTKMNYRCSCGREAAIVFDSFRRGNRCRACGNERASKKTKFERSQVADFFESQGCTLLGQYEGNLVPMDYICSCGSVSRINWNNFRKGRRCKACGIKKRSGENHYEWKPDREAHQSEFEFRQRCYKLIKMVLNVTGRVKNERSALLLGYDYKQLQQHITSHPNWSRVKDGAWHVDHVFPIKAFIDHGISDLKIINSLDNLRPLDAGENMRKNAKYNKDEFYAWLRSRSITFTQQQGG